MLAPHIVDIDTPEDWDIAEIVFYALQQRANGGVTDPAAAAAVGAQKAREQGD